MIRGLKGNFFLISPPGVAGIKELLGRIAMAGSRRFSSTLRSTRGWRRTTSLVTTQVLCDGASA